jgi:hypothetical protein
MRNFSRENLAAAIAVIILGISTVPSFGQTYAPGAYYSEQNTNWPPLPFDPFPSLPVYSLGGGHFVYNDTSVTYPPQTNAPASATAVHHRAAGFSPLYTTSDIWIEMLGLTNSQVYMRLHGTIGGELYQLDSTTNLSIPAKYWTPGEIITGASGTNFTDFSPVSISNGNPVFPVLIPQQFFRAHYADTVLDVGPYNPVARRPSTTNSNDGQTGQFLVQITQQVGTGPATIPFTYWMSGGAVNGTDYQTVSGSGVVTNSGGSGSDLIDIVPFVDNRNTLDVEAAMTFFLHSNYLVLPPANRFLFLSTPGSAVVTVEENYNGTSPFEFVTNAVGNIGMDYHPGSNALVISQNHYDPSFGGSPPGLDNFATLSTNSVLANRSQIVNLVFEVDLAIVQASTNGFTNGDMFFANGNPGGIGWLSANGVTSNLTWIDLSTIDPRESSAEGAYYIDRTGIFSNNLIAATSSGGIYVIDSHTNANQLAFFVGAGLEGVVTIPTNIVTYGPWAGKIITGAESDRCLFAIDTNGAASFYSFNIVPEDINIVPANQDFYLNDVFGQILKLPRHWLTNYVGDVLITQESSNSGDVSEVFILHWDAASTNFVKHGIRGPVSTGAQFEQGTFAPITITSSPISD